MTAAVTRQIFEDELKARWRGGPSVLAFLFAHPDSDAIQTLDARGRYFDVRSGDLWDLFFPGYYQSSQDRSFELQAGAQPVGNEFTSNWYFSARDFDAFRHHVEASSDERWRYSGETDLVLVNAWLTEDGEPTVDWVSTFSRQLDDRTTSFLSLSESVERITHDLEARAEDSEYGVGTATGTALDDRDGHDLIVAALVKIAAALGAKAVGL